MTSESSLYIGNTGALRSEDIAMESQVAQALRRRDPQGTSRGPVSELLERYRHSISERAAEMDRELAEGRNLRERVLDRLTDSVEPDTKFPRMSTSFDTLVFGRVSLNSSSSGPQESNAVIVNFESMHGLRKGRKSFSVYPSGHIEATFQDIDRSKRPIPVRHTPAERAELINALSAESSATIPDTMPEVTQQKSTIALIPRSAGAVQPRT